MNLNYRITETEYYDVEGITLVVKYFSDKESPMIVWDFSLHNNKWKLDNLISLLSLSIKESEIDDLIKIEDDLIELFEEEVIEYRKKNETANKLYIKLDDNSIMVTTSNFFMKTLDFSSKVDYDD